LPPLYGLSRTTKPPSQQSLHQRQLLKSGSKLPPSKNSLAFATRAQNLLPIHPVLCDHFCIEHKFPLTFFRRSF